MTTSDASQGSGDAPRRPGPDWPASDAGLSTWVALFYDLIFVAAMLGVAVLIGVVESTMARLKLTHIPILLVAACVLSAFGVILLER